MIRKIVEKLFWYYQEKDNWKMKMNEPIAIVKLTKEEAQEILEKQREEDANRIELKVEDNYKFVFSVGERVLKLDKDLYNNYSSVVHRIDKKYMSHMIEVLGEDDCADNILSLKIALEMTRELNEYEHPDIETPELLKELDKGIDDMENGHLTPQEESMRILKERYKEDVGE